MGILTSLFTSDSASKMIDGALSGIDKTFYTDQEKAESKKGMIILKTKLLEAYAPFKLTQRYLALIFSGLFSFLLLISTGLSAFGYIEEVKQIIQIIDVFSLNWIMLAIVSFYFSAGLIESYKRKS